MAAYTDDEIRAMTVPRLRSKLSLLDTSGRKAALVDRLIQAQVHHADPCESAASTARRAEQATENTSGGHGSRFSAS